MGEQPPRLGRVWAVLQAIALALGVGVASGVLVLLVLYLSVRCL